LLEYSCEDWDNCSQTDNNKLEKLQLKAARIVTGLIVYSSRESLYQEMDGKHYQVDRNAQVLMEVNRQYDGLPKLEVKISLSSTVK
jgi:ribosomal protein L14